MIYAIIALGIGLIFGAIIEGTFRGQLNVENRAGTIVVDLADNDRDIYRLEFDKPPEFMASCEYVIFDVEVLR